MCKELCDAPDNETGEMVSCQDCGRLICWDVEVGDDVVRPAYATSSGDLFCDLCGSSHDRAEEDEHEDEECFDGEEFWEEHGP